MPNVPPVSDEHAAARRKGVRRTVIAIGTIAVAIYVVFILSGVTGQ